MMQENNQRQHVNKNSTGSDYWKIIVLALLTLLVMTSWASLEATDSTVFIVADDDNLVEENDVKVQNNQKPVLRCRSNTVMSCVTMILICSSIF